MMTKRDTPGLVRLGVQLTLLLGSAWATLQLAATDHPLWVVAVAVCGVSVATFFPPLHEAGHGTAFRTPALNSAVHWLGAMLMLQAPTFFSEFHWEHHRQTQDPERDPEIASAPALLDDWPSNPIAYLGLVSGQPLMLGKAMFTLGCALPLGDRMWQRLFPFVPAARRRRIAWESRIVVLVFAVGLAFGLREVPGFGTLLLAWPVAHVVLGLYLMPEHTGLPADGSQIHRTRTLRTNALVRWFMWNMPYHAEHHVHPMVPFHAVPELHRRLAPALEHVSAGYLAFHAEALRRALGLGPSGPPV